MRKQLTLFYGIRLRPSTDLCPSIYPLSWSPRKGKTREGVEWKWRGSTADATATDDEANIHGTPYNEGKIKRPVASVSCRDGRWKGRRPLFAELSLSLCSRARPRINRDTSQVTMVTLANLLRERERDGQLSPEEDNNYCTLKMDPARARALERWISVRPPFDYASLPWNRIRSSGCRWEIGKIVWRAKFPIWYIDYL